MRRGVKKTAIRFAKGAFLHVCRSAGLFRLSRHLMRRKLRILCYHGFELWEESRFRPNLFMGEATFCRRLQTIKKLGFPVLPLAEALDCLQRGSLPDDAVAITIDDGFFSVYAKGAGLLSSHDMPATVYLTTYYVHRQNPIFRLVVQYMFWRSTVKRLELRGRSWAEDQEIRLDDDTARELALWTIIDRGEQCDSEEEREIISQDLGRLLGVDYHKLKASRTLSLMSTQEVRALRDQGFDIQLHTHRHRFPNDDEASAKKEIRENKEAIDTMIDGAFEHFCYPSGVWGREQWPWLESLGVKSATTCDPGLNDARTPPFGLKRFLDGENISQIEFEAELLGFLEMARRARRVLQAFRWGAVATLLATRYGGRRSWLRHHAFLFTQIMGRYRALRRVDWRRVKRLVFACNGNICRSPYGESRASEWGVESFSFGISGNAGRPVDATALRVGRRRGVELSTHVSKAVGDFALREGDLLLGMEPWHAEALYNIGRQVSAQVTLLGLWHRQPRPHIEDPYGRSEAYFETCFSVIDDAIRHIVDRMNEPDIR